VSSQIPETPPTAAHAKADSTSLGDLLSDVTRDLSTLIRQEIGLAKAELKESGTRAGKGGGTLAGAAVACHFVLLFLSVALWYTLGELMGLGGSAVVVAVIWGIIAAILASVGRRELKAIKGMPQTAETLQEIPPTLKPKGDHR
jgi:hypothetical protein